MRNGGLSGTSTEGLGELGRLEEALPLPPPVQQGYALRIGGAGHPSGLAGFLTPRALPSVIHENREPNRFPIDLKPQVRKPDGLPTAPSVPTASRRPIHTPKSPRAISPRASPLSDLFVHVLVGVGCPLCH